jgi:hypothetical protein
VNAPHPALPGLVHLAPEWERLQLLAYCVAANRNGAELAAADLNRLRELQAAVDHLRSPGGVWEQLLGEHLSAVECDVLAAVVGPEFEPRLGWTYQNLQGGQKEPWPSRALVHELLALEPHQGESLRSALAPSGTLRRARLIASARDEAWQPLQPESGLIARLAGRCWQPPAPPGSEAVVGTSGWEDLVLPADRLRMLREFMLWIEHRATVEDAWGAPRSGGPVALFAGPSGTGKTLAARVIASAMAWPLFRIDLGRLVSKYVGETEENLNRLFDAAHDQPMVLQFDEADALFARRGEIKEARDRYANMEVSHLLSRIESHRGPVILTTNLRRNLDAAFTRRLQLVVEFPRPDVDARTILWTRLLPPRAPLANGLDIAELGSAVALTGGQIRNAALHAAYLAAGAGGAIGPSELALGIWREINKDGRECAPGELGPLAAHLPDACRHG